jgi:subtilisin family serine protease
VAHVRTTFLAVLLALLLAAPAYARGDIVPGRVIVKYAAGASARGKNAARDAVGGDVIRQVRARTQLLEVDGRVRAAVRRLDRRRAIAWAEPLYRTHVEYTPNDPLFGAQWGLLNTGQFAGGVVGADIDAVQAWDRTRGDAATLLGVVDTGVKWDHPDLGGFWLNADEVAGNDKDDDANGFVDDMRGWDFQNSDSNPLDDNGHGTAVTSVAAARTNNAVGVAGVAGGVTVIEAKAMNASGNGDTAREASALNYLAAQGARVVNASIGSGYSQALADVVTAHPDTLFVASAGNDGADDDATPQYLCALPSENVLCVGASTNADERASFSNWGATTVDLMAPGTAIDAANRSNNGYAFWQGTSFSSPMAAGVAALLFSHRPQATPAMVKRAMMDGVDAVPAFAGITVTGGRLNADRALDEIEAATAAAPAASVAPEISGTVRMERSMIASTGAWSGGPDAFRYQWLRCSSAGASCAEIAGATGASYTAAPADVGKTLRVRVTATAGPRSGVATSAQTAVVGADPPAASVLPAVSGTYVYGQRLSSTAGTWSGAPAFRYQWLSCLADGTGCQPISGATSYQYVLALGQIGRTVRMRVTATGPGGATIVQSAATPSISGTAPSARTVPGISGVQKAGTRLTAVDGSWAGAPAPTLSRRWLRCNTEGDNCDPVATGLTYTLGEADIGTRMRLEITATNAWGTSTQTSAAYAVVTPLAPSASPAPSVSGTPMETVTLTGNDGTWRGVPTPALSRSWLRCDTLGSNCIEIDGATGGTYTPTSADLGRKLRFRVIGTNSGGTMEVRSAASGQVAPPPVLPTANGVPTVTGTAQAGKTLTATAVTWTGGTPLPSYSRAWLRCDAAGDNCAPIAGATALTYTPKADDVGSTLRHRATATNIGGAVHSASDPTAVVLPAVPTLTAGPAITGTAIEASDLSIGTGSWSSSPNSYAYQWTRCDSTGAGCADIAGETTDTHALVPADVGHRVRVRVTATNIGGTSAPYVTAPSAVVAGRPPQVTSAASVIGDGAVGRQLTLATGSWTGTAPVTYTYSWRRCPTSGTCTTVGSGTTYTLTAADVGKVVQGVVTATNVAGTRQSAAPAVGPVGHVLFADGFDGGGLSAWDVHCPPGNLTLGSSGPAPFAGDGRARFEVNPGDVSPVGGNRCEVSTDLQLREGSDVYNRFQVRLGAGWPFEPGRWAIVWQEHHAGSTGTPPLGLNVTADPGGGGHLSLDSNGEGPFHYWSGPAVHEDRWYDFVIHVHHSQSGSVGFVEVWLDGVRQTMANGASRVYHRTLFDDFNYPKLGYYRDPDHTAQGVVYGDGFVVGDSAGAVGLPWQS